MKTFSTNSELTRALCRAFLIIPAQRNERMDKLCINDEMSRERRRKVSNFASFNSFFASVNKISFTFCVFDFDEGRMSSRDNLLVNSTKKVEDHQRDRMGPRTLKFLDESKFPSGSSACN